MSDPFAGSPPTLLLPQSVALPIYGRSDLSYTNVSVVQPLTAGLVTQHVVPGQQIEIPQQISFTWKTSSVVGVRTLGIDFHDSQGDRVGVAFASGQQAENTTANYTFSLSATAVAIPNTFYVSTLPYMILQPTFLWVLTGSGLDPGDQQDGLTHTELVVPTGPPLTAPTVTPVVTPVIV